MSRETIHRSRVRYAETDAMGVAHHGAFAVWLEEARIRALDELGTSYRDLEAGGCYMPVVELRIRYRRPLRFDDGFAITSVAHVDGPSRLRFASLITGPAGEAIAEASVTVAAVDAGGRPRRLPPAIVAALAAPG
jgi:acyl-CoA thioester hydrolase